jgi:signal transduction histidine kinase
MLSGWLTSCRKRYDSKKIVVYSIGNTGFPNAINRSIRILSFCSSGVPPLPDLNSFQENLLERLPVAVCACDPQGKITHVNQRAVELWQKAPDPELRFSGAARLYDSKNKPLGSMASPLAFVLRCGKPQYNKELILERWDGSRISILSNASPLFDAKNNLLGGLEVFQDITEHKWSEEARRVAERAAASARVATLVAQQIIRPLHSIAGLLDVLRRDATLTAEARAYTEMIQQELTRFDRLAQEMGQLGMAA